MAPACGGEHTNTNIEPGYGIWTFTFSLRLPSGRGWPKWIICDARGGGSDDTGNSKKIRKRLREAREYFKREALGKIDDAAKPEEVRDRLQEARGYLRIAALGEGDDNKFTFGGLEEWGEVGKPHNPLYGPRPSPQQPYCHCKVRGTNALYPCSDLPDFPVRKPVPDQNEIFANEFLVSETVAWTGEHNSRDAHKRLKKASRSAYHAQFNLAAILAYRRSQFFVRTLAQRVNHVFLPWGWLYDVNGNREGRKEGTNLGYVIFPSLTLVRRSDSPQFRRTFSLTFTLAPVKVPPDPKAENGGDAEVRPAEPVHLTGAKADVPEAHRLLRSLHTPEIFFHRDGCPGQYELGGPLKEYVDALQERISKVDELAKDKKEVAPPFQLCELARFLLRGIAFNCAPKSKLSRNRLRDLGGIVQQAVSISTFSGHVRALDVSREEVAQWLKASSEADGRDAAQRVKEFSKAHWADKAIDQLLEEDLKSWVCPYGCKDIHHDKNRLRFSYEMGLDEPTPLFYVPWEKMVLEVFGNNVHPQESSHLWVAGWQNMLTTGLSALSETVGSFHREVERQRGPGAMSRLANEYVVDCEEHLDMDLAPYFKPNFSRLKKMAGLSEEYERLREKVVLLTETTRAQEQSSLRRNVMWLSTAAIFFAAASLFGKFKSSSISQAGVILVAVLVVAVMVRTHAYERWVMVWITVATFVLTIVGALVVLFKSPIPTVPHWLKYTGVWALAVLALLIAFGIAVREIRSAQASR